MVLLAQSAFIRFDQRPIACRLIVFIEKFIRRTDILCAEPLAGRVVPEVPGRELRELIEGNYRIVYRTNDGTVEILTVFESHKLVKNDF